MRVLIALSNKKNFFILFFFLLFVVFLETFSLNIIYDVSRFSLNLSEDLKNKYFFFKYLDPSNESTLISGLIFFLTFLFLKNIIIIFVTIFKNKFIFNALKKTTLALHEKYINQNYDFFIKKNSSELVSNINNNINIMIRTYDSIYSIVMEIVLIFCFLFFLFLLNPYTTIYFILLISFLFITYIFFSKKKIIILSNQRLTINYLILKNLQQSFSNFREMIIYNCQKFFIADLKDNLIKFTDNLRISNNLQQLTRMFLEQAFIISIIILFLFYKIVKSSSSISDFYVLLSIYAYAFIRILPSLNKLINETQSYLYNKLFVKKIYEDLYDLSPNSVNLSKNFTIKNSIEIKNLKFFFKKEKQTLFENINININVNEKIGLIGKSGEGKSTLLNIIMGLLKPSVGEILVDGENINKNLLYWQSKIGYVSQSTFILDDTLKVNITFQHDPLLIDINQLSYAIKFSGLETFVSNLSEGENTILGEKGSKISGGEIQRIGLARALYKDPEIFILDEFTSFLDIKTELDILQKISLIKKTFIIASHRRSTFKDCVKIYELNNKKINLLK
jgi:ABC-type multidrug transport system fused ATPase/permease subunit